MRAVSLRAALVLAVAVALGLGLGLAPLGCSRVNQAPDAETQAPATGPTPTPISVTLREVVIQRVERTVDFVGTLHAFAEAEVAAEVDGRLVSLNADLGDQVAKGQVLATLDDAERAAKLREAEASLAKNDADQRRAQQLRAQGVMSQQEFDAIASAANVSRARRDVLAIQVENSRIRAPFDGRIAKRMADVGDYVRTGTPLFVLVADNPLRLRGEVPERFAAEIRTGQEVRGYVEAFLDDAIEGRLTRISPAANPQSRALTVEALVPNGDGRLKTGFFCKAQILTRADSQALVIPVEALVTFAGVTRAFVVDESGTAHSREIQTGLRLGTVVEVTHGLSAGERVATSGLARLSEGTRVAVREEPTGPAGLDVGTHQGETPKDEPPPDQAAPPPASQADIEGHLPARLGRAAPPLPAAGAGAPGGERS